MSVGIESGMVIEVDMSSDEGPAAVMTSDVEVSREGESVTMVGISTAVEGVEDLMVAPGGMLMAVTVEVAGLELVTFVARRENFLVETVWWWVCL